MLHITAETNQVKNVSLTYSSAVISTEKHALQWAYC